MSALSSPGWGGDIVPLRRRADLEVRPSFAAPAQTWLVKDPVSLRYYELPDEERFVWQLLDGATTWNELRARYDRNFAPRQLDARRLFQLLEELHRRGLVVSDRIGQGAALRERAAQLRRAEFWNRLANPLAVRLPGMNPQGLLERLNAWLAPLFTRGFVAIYAALCLLGLLTAVVYFDDLRRELSAAAGRFPEVAYWPLWIAAVIGAKIVHEVAHAVTCRRFGGETRELGVLLLCGFPCLYCDVSSMWMTPERWKRIVVGAGGMLAEILLAAVAILLWHASEPGLMHDFCLHLAVVCSVGTVLVNANPLLRYDGYFILSDLIGMTNLGEQAEASLRAFVGTWLFGEEWSDERRLPSRRRRALAVYALASLVYRCVLIVGVLWLLRRWLQPHGLTLFADLLTVVVVGGLLFTPLRRGLHTVQTLRSGVRGDRRRFAIRLTAVSCLALAALLWPWPYHVKTSAVVGLRDAEYVYVTAGGELREGVQLGATIEAGDVLARLDDPQLRRDVIRLQADVARHGLEIDNLERRRIADPSQADALPAARELLAAAERQLQLRLHEKERLRIVARRSGTVVPLLALPGDENLANYGGRRTSPLEPERRGAYLATGTPLCAIGDPHRLECDLTVDQEAVEYVAVGQTVRMRFGARPGMTFAGRIVEIAETDDEAATRATNSTNDAPVERRANDAAGGRYWARVVFDGAIDDLPVGAVGEAKIEAAPQSLLTRGRRALESTFRFAGPSQ